MVKSKIHDAFETVEPLAENLNLLDTIRIPKNLALLRQNLPKSNYDSGVKK